MKIYTKTGDDGKTSLFDNSRVWKSHDRILSYGAVDELNSSLDTLEKTLNDELKSMGSKDKVKLKKYKPTTWNR